MTITTVPGPSPGGPWKIQHKPILIRIDNNRYINPNEIISIHTTYAGNAEPVRCIIYTHHPAPPIKVEGSETVQRFLAVFDIYDGVQ